MGHTRLCEYQGQVTMADGHEFITGVENVKEARLWVTHNEARQYGQADFVKIVMWPQTSRARRFVAGRGDFIVVTKERVLFAQIS